MFRTSTLVPYFTVIQTPYVSVASTLIQVAKPNPDRAAIYFTNAVGLALNLYLPGNPNSNEPNLILPGGGTLKLIWEYDGILTTEQWYWIGTAGGQGLTVTEIVWQPPTGM